MIKLELNEYHDMIKIANIEKEDSWPHDLSDLLGEKVAILTLYMKKQVSY